MPGIDKLASEVHFWALGLDVPAAVVPALQRLLSGAEREQARLYRNQQEYSRFIVRRAARRIILAGYLGDSPEKLVYWHSVQGKPRLASDSPVVFNCSASADLAVVAVASRGRIGVDVEHLQPVPEALDIARHFFNDTEQRALLDTPASERDALFLRYWTRKEAHYKALGIGLSKAPENLRWEWDSEVSVRLVRGNGRRSEPLTLISLDAASTYLAAVACNAAGVSVRLRLLGERWYEQRP